VEQVARPEIPTLTGDPASPELASYRALVGSWLLTLEARGRSKGTRTLYRFAAFQLGDYLASQGMPLEVTAIRREHLESFLIDVQRRHPGTSTAATLYRCLRSFFTWLYQDEEEITSHPMARMHEPTFTQREVPVLPDAAVTALLSTVAHGRDFEARRDHAILRLLLDTPLRRTELAQLKTTEVDLPSRVVHVTVKGNRERSVPFGVKAAQAVDRYLRARGSHRYASLPRLWLGARGAFSGDSLYAMLRKRANEANLPDGMHPHLFRHLFAHSWLVQGGQEADLMRLGGWRSREIMARYAESAADARAVEAYRRLSPGDRF
jgi:site-specific recombinase XerD